jgi:hypothetical protein
MQNGNGGIGNAKKMPLDWPTLVLILVTGGGNFLANQQGRNQLSYEQQEAIAKIREIHGDLEHFETGMKTSLTNQNKMMETDAALLNEIHRIAKNLEAMHRYDQMRGAPQ